MRIDSRESIHANYPDSHCESPGHLSCRTFLQQALYYVECSAEPSCKSPKGSAKFWELLSKNRKRGRQTGVPGTAIVPLSTIGTRYGNSVSTPYASKTNGATRPQLTRHDRESQRKADIRKFRNDPASSIRTSIADPVFADPVSETHILESGQSDPSLRTSLFSS